MHVFGGQDRYIDVAQLSPLGLTDVVDVFEGNDWRIDVLRRVLLKPFTDIAGM
jgi:hypothetical protein